MTKYTIADIAKEAGVAKSTVSRYFNGGYVKDETRKKIKTVVDRTGFEPSAAAQNLKRKHTKIIGVVAPDMTSAIIGRLLNAISRELHKEGYTCLIVSSHHDPKQEIAAIENLRSLRCDGIILIANTIGEEHRRLKSTSSVPLLVLGQHFPQGTSIIYDDFMAGQEVGAFARLKGHHNVVYIGINETDDSVGHQRRLGVMNGLNVSSQEARFEFLEMPVACTGRELGARIRETLDASQATMVICSADPIALAASREIKKKGLCIPQDISLIGFGGYELCDMLEPSLTSIQFDDEAAGVLSAKTMISMIREETIAPLQVVGHRFKPGSSVADRNLESQPDLESEGIV